MSDAQSGSTLWGAKLASCPQLAELGAHLGLAPPPQGLQSCAVTDQIRSKKTVAPKAAATTTWLVHHSDQGSQYVSLIFGERCRDAGVRGSMGSKATPTTTPSRNRSSPRSRKTAPPPLVPDPPGSEDCRLRLHRDPLQPDQAPLDPRLLLAGPVRENEQEEKAT
jgi:hypothetical protein